jgi:type VI secretion system protein ImpF
MSGQTRRNRLSSPVMFAFRRAHETREGRAASASAREEPATVARAARAAITEPQLRREVTRDMVLLLNTVNLGSSEDLSAFPAVARSVLNFGLPDLSTRTINDTGLEAIGRELTQALTDYEPRLVSEVLSVERDTTVDAAALKIRFLVKADLVCDPVDVPVEFAADVEVDTGKIRVDPLS